MKPTKNEKAIGAIFMIIGVCLIISGCILGLLDINMNAIPAFLMCLTGTVTQFYGNYLRNGYLKFFN